jgi:hypothetical protein
MSFGSRRWGWIGLAFCLVAGLAWALARFTAPPPTSWAAERQAVQAALAAAADTDAAAKKEVGEAEKKTDKPGARKRQTPEEADAALEKLMAERKPVRAATARGQMVADAPAFKVVPREDRIRRFPCTKCHDNKFVDGRVRELGRSTRT